jgi:hypothetical protein
MNLNQLPQSVQDCITAKFPSDNFEITNIEYFPVYLLLSDKNKPKSEVYWNEGILASVACETYGEEPDYNYIDLYFDTTDAPLTDSLIVWTYQAR